MQQTHTDNMIKIWHIISMLCAYLFAISLAGVYFTSAEIGTQAALHTLSVSVLFTVCVVRIIWGYTGTTQALFSSMVPNIGALFLNIYGLFNGESKKTYVGHSPVGGTVAFMLLAFGLFTSLTGLMIVNGAGQGSWLAKILGVSNAQGPIAMHDTLTSITVVLFALHGAGTLWSLYTNKTPFLSFFLKGEEPDPYASIHYTDKAQTETSYMGTTALAVCIAVMMLVPALSDFGAVVQKSDNKNSVIQQIAETAIPKDLIENELGYRNQSFALTTQELLSDDISTFLDIQPAAGPAAAFETETFEQKPVFDQDMLDTSKRSTTRTNLRNLIDTGTANDYTPRTEPGMHNLQINLQTE